MRWIYVNDRCVRISMDCGLFPIRKCPVQIYAKNNKFGFDMCWNGLFDRAILLRTERNITKQIRIICNNCKYGSEQKTR